MTRALVAKFLTFYPQYKLADLREMPAEEFLYLIGGMLDIEAPEATESTEERVNRVLRERASKAHKRATARSGM